MILTLVTGNADIWAKLSAPVPSVMISWRKKGKTTARDGKYFVRFVPHIEPNTIRERLDTVVPGEWDLTLELLPSLAADDDEGAQCSFKARLQILGVIREDIGTGRDYKQASTDAFKRAAVRFGIAHEMYAYEQNWVEMDGDGRYAKPLEHPQLVYVRHHGLPGAAAIRAGSNASGLPATSPSLLSDRSSVDLADGPSPEIGSSS